MSKIYILDPQKEGIAEIAAKNGFITTDRLENDIFQLKALILEVSRPSAEINFALAKALLFKRPILCLGREYSEIIDFLSFLGNKGVLPRLKIEFYKERVSLEEKMMYFLRNL